MHETEDIKRARVEALKASLDQATVTAAVGSVSAAPKRGMKEALRDGEAPAHAAALNGVEAKAREKNREDRERLSAALKTIAKGRK